MKVGDRVKHVEDGCVGKVVRMHLPGSRIGPVTKPVAVVQWEDGGRGWYAEEKLEAMPEVAVSEQG